MVVRVTEVMGTFPGYVFTGGVHVLALPYLTLLSHDQREKERERERKLTITNRLHAITLPEK